MASPAVSAVSSSFELLNAPALSSKEHESGELALGMVLYQEGANLDAKLFALLWIASVSAPRLAQLAKDKKDKGKANPEGVKRELKAIENK